MIPRVLFPRNILVEHSQKAALPAQFAYSTLLFPPALKFFRFASISTITTSSGTLSSHKPGRMGARNFLICDELPRRLRGFAVA